MDPALVPNPICVFAFSKQGHPQLIWPRCIILTTAGQSQWPAAHHSLPLWVSNGKHTPCGRAHILYMHKYNTEYSIYYLYNQILHGKYGTWQLFTYIIDAYTLNYKLESDLWVDYTGSFKLNTNNTGCWGTLALSKLLSWWNIFPDAQIYSNCVYLATEIADLTLVRLCTQVKPGASRSDTVSPLKTSFIVGKCGHSWPAERFNEPH